jgi:DNA adenine methylase
MTSIISPLRYPGSKRRLAKYIDQVLQDNELQPDLFVEPFAGGASVTLHLLQNDRVKQAGLIEKDPLVAAFWQIVFSKDEADRTWLVDQVKEIEVTLKKWRELKGKVPEALRERALACLYLNRTSFSGILAPSSGPLGGHGQKSPYPIDCRFPREVLIKRIQQAAALRDRVAFVWEADWKAGLKKIDEQQEKGDLPKKAFYYFDPPFFHKAEKLYSFYFANGDHEKLRDTVLGLDTHWVLSYDYCDKVDELYQGNQQTHVEALYSAAQNGGSRAVKEVIFTNLPKLPADRKLWKATTERKNGHSPTDPNAGQ